MGSNDQTMSDMQECMGRSLEVLSNAFMASARRWELIVYPSLVAFVILAAYGFYLVYSLTVDVTRVANQMEQVTVSMTKVAESMNTVSSSMLQVAQRMENMTESVHAQETTMKEMVANMQNMNRSMQYITGNMSSIRQDMAVMNHSVSRPMSMINSFMPW